MYFFKKIHLQKGEDRNIAKHKKLLSNWVYHQVLMKINENLYDKVFVRKKLQMKDLECFGLNDEY